MSTGNVKDTLKELDDPVKMFEKYYQRTIQSGKLPLEFAGALGKEWLQKFYVAGGAHALLGAALSMLADKVE